MAAPEQASIRGRICDHLLTHKDVEKRKKYIQTHTHTHTQTHTHTKYLRAEGSLVDAEQSDSSLGKTKPTEHISRERTPLHEALQPGAQSSLRHHLC